NLDDTYAPTDSFIHRDHPFLHVANFSSAPLVIEEGQALGTGHNPELWLDQISSFSEDQKNRAFAHANLISQLAKVDPNKQPTKESSLTIRTEVPHLHTTRKSVSDDIPEEEPVEGGPKTAETTPEDFSASIFPRSLDLAPELDDGQRSQLLEVLSKHERAFSLDGRLGTIDAACTIPLRNGAREVSLPPFPASPAKREVI
ncbi:hypothetical protein K474DRAFT_1568136, partial [Panus rudis PR-1116 ss-1]